MKTLPVTFPIGSTGFASSEDVAAAVRYLLMDHVTDRSTSECRDEGSREAINLDCDRAIIPTIVERATEREIVAQ
jgi:hypothetical protein